MKIIVYIWPDIDIYAIKLLRKYAFLYFTSIIRTPATGRQFVVKIARIVIEFLRKLFGGT